MYEDTICMRIDTFEFVLAEVGSRISYILRPKSKPRYICDGNHGQFTMTSLEQDNTCMHM